MTMAEIVSYLLMVLPVLMGFTIVFGCAAVFAHSYKMMIREKQQYLNVGGWIALMIGVVLSIVLFDGLGVAKFNGFTKESGAAITMMFASILVPIFGLKIGAKISDSKAGINVEQSGGGA